MSNKGDTHPDNSPSHEELSGSVQPQESQSVSDSTKSEGTESGADAQESASESSLTIGPNTFIRENFEARESVEIRATAQSIFSVVTDISRTGEFSPVCTGCWWKDKENSPDDDALPQEGMWFIGRNETPTRTWETESLVTSVVPNEKFAWAVGGGIVEWGYEIEPTDVPGISRLTETWKVTDSGFEFFVDKYGNKAEEELADRRRSALSGIPETLNALKKAIEQES